MSADLDSVSLISRLDEFLTSRAWTLPVCAAPTGRLLKQLDSPATRPQLAKLAMSDPTLLIAVLREANSSHFDGLEPTAEIEGALSRLGEERAEGLLRGVLSACRFEGDSDVLLSALDHSRRRALAVAGSAAQVARATGFEALADEAARLGMLSELGTAFLITALQARIDEYDAPLTEFATHEILAQLQRGYRNRLLELWRFPRRTIEVLSDRASGIEERRLVGILELAREVIAGAGLPAVGVPAAEETENELWELAESFELSNVELAALLVRAEDVVNDLAPGYAAR